MLLQQSSSGLPWFYLSVSWITYKFWWSARFFLKLSSLMDGSDPSTRDQMVLDFRMTWCSGWVGGRWHRRGGGGEGKNSPALGLFKICKVWTTSKLFLDLVYPWTNHLIQLNTVCRFLFFIHKWSWSFKFKLIMLTGGWWLILICCVTKTYIMKFSSQFWYGKIKFILELQNYIKINDIF
jgi:hypothetical protein